MSKKAVYQTVDEIDRERLEVWGRSGVFARRKGCRQPAAVVKAKSRMRAARWRSENDRVRRPETAEVALFLLRAMVRLHDPDNIDPEDRTLVGSALTEMLTAGYDLNQIQAVCRRVRKRVLAEDRSTEES
jgi:hypothetical protein